jgi:hypothetical protein
MIVEALVNWSHQFENELIHTDIHSNKCSFKI